MVNGQDWRMMSSFTAQNVNDGLLRIQDATSTVDDVMGKVGLSPVGDFMTNMALKETWAGAGYDTSATHTMGPWQIDPIKMYDIQQNIANSETYQKRAAAINQYMASQGYEGFDIGNMATVVKDGDSYSYGDMGEYANNPLANAFLARLGLASVPEQVPTALPAQGVYWKKHWNKSGAGKADEFVDMVQKWRPEYSTVNHGAY